MRLVASLRGFGRACVRGAARARAALAVAPSKSLDDILARPIQLQRGAYTCRAQTVAWGSAVEHARLNKEVGGMQVQAMRLKAGATGTQARRLTSAIEVYARMLEETDSDACVTVRDMSGKLLSVAYVSDAPAIAALEIDLIASHPQCLMGARPIGQTPGEAALATCVLLSVQCGFRGALEANVLPSARGWYAAHGFHAQGIGCMRRPANSN